MGSFGIFAIGCMESSLRRKACCYGMLMMILGPIGWAVSIWIGWKVWRRNKAQEA